MYRDRDELPVVPHEWADGTDCCGCLVPTTRHNKVDLVCNECGQVVKTVEATDVERTLSEILMSQPICSERCPHCGALNTFPGFSAIEAFTCCECGEGVVLDRTAQ
jgi:hypothetical protein